MLKLVGGVGLALMLGACAGRAPQLSPLVLASDETASCKDLATESQRNSDQMEILAIEETMKLGQNVVAGVSGFMIWPAWLALDFQNAAGKEAKALEQRNRQLAGLARNRCGSTREHTATVAELPLAPTSTLAARPEISTSLVSY